MIDDKFGYYITGKMAWLFILLQRLGLIKVNLLYTWSTGSYGIAYTSDEPEDWGSNPLTKAHFDDFLED